MKKDLPNVFANAINKKFDNVQEVFVSTYDQNDDLKRTPRKKSIENKINMIFNSPNHVYKSRVLLTTEDRGTNEETIVGRTNSSILTLDGKRIRIYEIIDIEEI